MFSTGDSVVPEGLAHMLQACRRLVQLVFLLNKSLPAVEGKDYSVAEICAAAERTAGFETVEGAQRIVGLWRLYAKDNEARIKLLVSEKSFSCERRKWRRQGNRHNKTVCEQHPLVFFFQMRTSVQQ